jgi:hypothetical protein
MGMLPLVMHSGQQYLVNPCIRQATRREGCGRNGLSRLLHLRFVDIVFGKGSKGTHHEKGTEAFLVVRTVPVFVVRRFR